MAFFQFLAPIRNLLKRMYNWTLAWSKTKQAPYALFLVAFIESSFFPIPPDVLLIAMVVGARDKWFKNASICTLGSVIGALFGYLIGWLFYESIGKILIHIYHLESAIDLIGSKYAQNAFLTVLTAAFTPIPFKVITIGAGLFKIHLRTLIVASIIGRGARFYGISFLLRIFGKRIERLIQRYFDLFSVIFISLLIGGFILVKYLCR